MYKLKKGIVIITIIAGLVGAVIALGQLKTPAGLQTMNGQPVTIEQVLQVAPVVVITYWEVNCPYCQQQLLELREVHRTFIIFNADVGQVVAQVVTINTADSDSKAADFLGRIASGYPSLVGGTLPAGASGLPYTEVYVEGQLVQQWVGLQEADVILAFVASLFSQGGEA